MQAPNAVAQRSIALGLLVLAVAVLYLGLVRPYFDTYRAVRENIATLTERLQRYQAIAASRSDVMQRTRQMRASRDLKKGFLNSKTPTLASAELQQYATRAIGQSGGQLLSTQVIPPKDDAGMVAATIKIGMRGTSQTLQKLFHALERGAPAVVLDNLSVRNRQRRGAAEVLDIRFALTAYLRPEPASQARETES
ncbi:MAG: type II secretion system protein GspM [Gammaproteobacteria bacterium]|nr:type II secretion system protein GspM [Gammaproteobacteria bacterium]